MLNAAPRTLRHGTSLAELLVAMVLAGVVLGTATTSVLRQQRTADHVAAQTLADAQGRSAVEVLRAELGQLERGGGDLAEAEASDTAFQFRSLVATSVACETSVGAVVLSPEDSLASVGASTASAPRASDSLWWRVDSSWRAVRVDDAGLVNVSCASTGNVRGAAWRLVLHESDTVAVGAVLRVTRGARYAFYRGSDGSWQLGYREWSEGTHRFAAPQPVAGPFHMRVGTLRTGFRYFDSTGVELAPVNGSVNGGLVARVRITTLGPAVARTAAGDTIHVDSADVALRPPAS